MSVVVNGHALCQLYLFIRPFCCDPYVCWCAFLPWRAISIHKGSVVSTGDKPEWLRFIFPGPSFKHLINTVESLQDGNLTAWKHAATDMILTPPLCLPLFSLCCALALLSFFCRSVSVSCFLPLSVSASSSPSYSSYPPFSEAHLLPLFFSLYTSAPD